MFNDSGTEIVIFGIKTRPLQLVLTTKPSKSATCCSYQDAFLWIQKPLKSCRAASKNKLNSR